MTDLLRWTVAILSSFGLAVLWGTVLLRWRISPVETRNRGAALIPLLIAVDYGSIYGLIHHLPLNKGLWLTVPALVIFDAVWAYYFAREAKTPAAAVTRAKPTPFDESNHPRKRKP